MLWLCPLLLAAPPAEPASFEPSKTVVVIAGVLQWPTRDIPGFPTKNRKDAELYEVLRKRGVPADRMRLLLDEQATYSGIRQAVRAVGAAARTDDTLVFYYCGHGSPVGTDLSLANYDLGPRSPHRNGLLASDLAGMVKESFRGRRVLFLADCCYSGGLGKAAATLRTAGFEAASLTSSDESMTSTRNWTFTQTVIDAFAGDTFADADRDGSVTLDELAGEVKAAMGALERQRSGFALHGLPGGLRLRDKVTSPAVGEGKYHPGDFVLAPDAGRPRAGRVVAAADGKYAVQFYDYTEKRRVTLPADKLAKLPDNWVAAKPKPADIEVEWKGHWYPASVKKRDGEKTLIHYEGWGDEWDEWVTADRIRKTSK